MKEEIDELLENENTTLADVFSLSSQEKQDEIMNQLRWGNKKVVSL
jgi:predicted Zn-ribbon and HTH transcriptional regulator